MLEEFPWLKGETENFQLGYNKTDIYFEYEPVKCSLVVGGKQVSDFNGEIKIKYILETDIVASPKQDWLCMEYRPNYNHKLQFTVDNSSEFMKFVIKKQYEADQKVQVLELPFNFVSDSMSIFGTAFLSRLGQKSGNVEFTIYNINGKSCKQ